MNTVKFIKNKQLSRPWVFFVVTYTWTWIFFGVSYILGLSAESGNLLGVILVLCAISGPTIAGITLVDLTLTKEGQQDYWKRVFDFRRIPLQWYCAIFLIIPTVSILAAIISGYWAQYSFSHKLPSLALTLVSVPLAPLLEELGWRGYVFDRLQEKHSAFISSVILGVLWWAWHLPLFFLPHSIFLLMPLGSLVFWLYFLNTLAISVIIGWVYNNTGRSTLSAVLLHTVLEFCANTGVIPWDKPEHIYNVTFLILFSLGVSYVYRSRQPENHTNSCKHAAKKI